MGGGTGVLVLTVLSGRCCANARSLSLLLLLDWGPGKGELDQAVMVEPFLQSLSLLQ
jgi:hypothetical protein